MQGSSETSVIFLIRRTVLAIAGKAASQWTVRHVALLVVAVLATLPVARATRNSTLKPSSLPPTPQSLATNSLPFTAVSLQ